MCLTGMPRMVHVKDVPKLGREDPPPGVIRAWRAWKIERGSLRSTYQSSTWPPNKPMNTHAPIKGGEAGRPVVGVHAVKKLEDIKLVTSVDLNDKTAVVGEVLLWGDVAEHDNGYRAEHAYPYRLWTNDFLATSTLRDAYGVAVEIKSVKDLMAEQRKK